MKLMVDRRSTKVASKVQSWYAFWYAWFGSHDIFHRIAKENGAKSPKPHQKYPSKTEQRKLPVKDWIRQMYQKRQEKSARKKARKGQAAAN